MNKYKLYISGQFVGEYASAEGVWARLGQRTFGDTFMVYGINGADTDQFVTF